MRLCSSHTMTRILRGDFLVLAFESLFKPFIERENRFLNKLITAFTFCLELLREPNSTGWLALKTGNTGQGSARTQRFSISFPIE